MYCTRMNLHHILEMKEKLSLGDVTQYAYTNGSGCFEIPGFDDKEEYKVN